MAVMAQPHVDAGVRGRDFGVQQGRQGVCVCVCVCVRACVRARVHSILLDYMHNWIAFIFMIHLNLIIVDLIES